MDSRGNNDPDVRSTDARQTTELNEQLRHQFDDMDVVPYTKTDRLLSYSILAVVVVNLLFVIVAIIWGN